VHRRSGRLSTSRAASGKQARNTLIAVELLQARGWLVSQPSAAIDSSSLPTIASLLLAAAGKLSHVEPNFCPACTARTSYLLAPHRPPCLHCSAPALAPHQAQHAPRRPAPAALPLGGARGTARLCALRLRRRGMAKRRLVPRHWCVAVGEGCGSGCGGWGCGGWGAWLGGLLFAALWRCRRWRRLLALVVTAPWTCAVRLPIALWSCDTAEPVVAVLGQNFWLPVCPSSQGAVRVFARGPPLRFARPHPCPYPCPRACRHPRVAPPDTCGRAGAAETRVRCDVHPTRRTDCPVRRL
jgi:hypothetical protein